MEIGKSKDTLEKITNKPITSFAYPFGGEDSFDNETVNLVKQSGYKYACANIHERVRNNSNIFTLPRFVVRDWDLEEFKKQIKKFI